MSLRKVKYLLTVATVVVAVSIGKDLVTSGTFSFLQSNNQSISTETIQRELKDVVDDTTSYDFTNSDDLQTVSEDVVDRANEIAQNNGIVFEEATLVRVVDGDTIVVSINNEEMKVRMIGINTPESVASQKYLDKVGTTNSQEGIDASEYTKTLLEGVNTVYLQKDTSETDTYGRLLRYVWLEAPQGEITTDMIAENMVNGILLTSGAEKVAQPATYEPDTMYADEFEEIYENY